MKIGILTWMHSNDVCARVGCLNASLTERIFLRVILKK